MRFAPRHLVLAAVCAGALTVSAAAQSPDDSAGARIQVGPLGITPTLGLVNVGLDTNVFHDTINPKRDITTVSSGGANAVLRAGRTRLTIDARGDLVYFRQYASERGVDGTLDGVYKVLGNRVAPWVGARVTSARQRSGYEIDTRSRRMETRFSAGVDLRVQSRTTLRLEARRSEQSYDAGAEVLGTRLRDTLNRRGEIAMVTLSHQLTPLTAFVVDASAIRDRFVFSPERDTDSRRVVAGFDLSPLALIAGTGRIGYRTVGGTPGMPEFSGAVASIDASYTLLGRTKFEVVAQREIEYSVDRAYPYYVRTGAEFGITPRLSSHWDVEARASVQQLAYQHMAASALSARVDRFILVGGGVGYRLGRTRVGVNLDHRRRHSPLPGHGFDGVTMGMSMTYGR